MMEILRVYWLLGAVGIMAAVPAAIGFVVLESRRLRDPWSSALAVLWCALLIPTALIVEGNLSPPLFGVPITGIVLAARLRGQVAFVTAAATSYALLAGTVYFSYRAGSDLNVDLVPLLPVSLIALASWRIVRTRALSRPIDRLEPET